MILNSFSYLFRSLATCLEAQAFTSLYLLKRLSERPQLFPQPGDGREFVERSPRRFGDAGLERRHVAREVNQADLIAVRLGSTTQTEDVGVTVSGVDKGHDDTGQVFSASGVQTYLP